VTITGKLFLVSLLPDDWGSSGRNSLGDSAASSQHFRSCRRAGEVWVQGAVSRTSRAEIFGNAARYFLSTRVCPAAGGCRNGKSLWAWSRAGP